MLGCWWQFSKGENVMKLKSLEELYISELQDLYSAENQIVKALPKIIKAVSSSQLQGGLEDHLGQTREHVKRLEQILRKLDRSAKGKKCKGMAGLLEEGSELLKEDADQRVVDAALIGAAQRVEHYEIAAYGTAKTFARYLGHSDAEALLNETLEEEKQADQKLSDIAFAIVNEEAAATVPASHT
jgi:ferritin-like metal-binding protein YciE